MQLFRKIQMKPYIMKIGRISREVICRGSLSDRARFIEFIDDAIISYKMATQYTFELFPGRRLLALYLTNISGAAALPEQITAGTLPVQMGFLNPDFVRIPQYANMQPETHLCSV
jgi:hypothetical protein